PTAADWTAGTPDPIVLQHYHDVLAEMRTLGMKPVVTLFHWSSPLYLSDPNDRAAHPGWEDPAFADAFVLFASRMAAEFGAEVDLWVTENEPMVPLLAGYILGIFPPGFINEGMPLPTMGTVFENMVRAHARAYDAIHAADVADADGDGVPASVGFT